jgi:hypothetical protein
MGIDRQFCKYRIVKAGTCHGLEAVSDQYDAINSKINSSFQHLSPQS